jgi:hypothetical protein
LLLLYLIVVTTETRSVRPELKPSGNSIQQTELS